MENKPFLVTESNLRRYTSKKIIVDTKPLVLLLAGIYNYERIGKDKLTAGFEKEDFDLLYSFISNFKGIITTPHILAETSNILNNKIKPKRDFKVFFESIIKELEVCEEIYIQKEAILDRKEIKFHGITDIGIMLSSKKERALIITKDQDFSRMCAERGFPIVHFDVLRGLNWNIKQNRTP